MSGQRPTKDQLAARSAIRAARAPTHELEPPSVASLLDANAYELIAAPRSPARPRASPPSWYDPDVHSWSRRMRAMIDGETAGLVEASCEVPLEARESTLVELRATVRDQDAVRALDKMSRRSDARDTDLGGLHNLGMLAILWRLALERSGTERAAAAKLIEPTLSDMGTTCVQGDSHRMYSLYIALIRDARAVDVDGEPIL